MNYIYTLILGFVAGFIAARIVKKSKTAPQSADKYYNEADREKDQKLAAIMGLFDKYQTVTNNLIQTELGVSDATAERYCDELEKSGKITQVGRTGKFVTYKKS